MQNNYVYGYRKLLQVLLANLYHINLVGNMSQDDQNDDGGDSQAAAVETQGDNNDCTTRAWV